MTADAALDGGPRTVVLVEGLSDRLALEVLARRRDRDLAAGRIAVIAMNGATNLGRYLERYGPAGLNVKLAGLCDAAEEDYFRRVLRRAGIGASGSRAAMEALGFFVCTIDLEDELIRALGTDEVERIIEAQGELRSLRAELEAVVAAGDRVMLVMRTPGVDEYRHRQADDRTYDVVTVRDGLIVGLHACRDRGEARSLAGIG
jgi:hypothetical protein